MLDKSYSWFKKAAIAGHASSQAKLGSYNLFGIHGEQNLQRAAKWLEKAAAQGNKEAISYLESHLVTRAIMANRQLHSEGVPFSDANLGRKSTSAESVNSEKSQSSVNSGATSDGNPFKNYVRPESFKCEFGDLLVFLNSEADNHVLIRDA